MKNESDKSVDLVKKVKSIQKDLDAMIDIKDKLEQANSKLQATIETLTAEKSNLETQELTLKEKMN